MKQMIFATALLFHGMVLSAQNYQSDIEAMLKDNSTADFYIGLGSGFGSGHFYQLNGKVLTYADYGDSYTISLDNIDFNQLNTYEAYYMVMDDTKGKYSGAAGILTIATKTNVTFSKTNQSNEKTDVSMVSLYVPNKEFAQQTGEYLKNVQSNTSGTVSLTLQTNGNSQSGTPTDQDISDAALNFVSELRNNDFSNFMGTKKESYESDGETIWTYYSSVKFPGAIETIIQDPFFKTLSPYRYAQATFDHMSSGNGKVTTELYNKYKDMSFVLKKALGPLGFVFHCHDLDDYRLYKYRTTLTLSFGDNTGLFSSLQSNNKVVVEIYIDKSDSDSDNDKSSYPLILKFKIA